MGNDIESYCSCMQDKNICNESNQDREQSLIRNDNIKSNESTNNNNNNKILFKHLANDKSVNQFFIEDPSNRDNKDDNITDKKKIKDESESSKNDSTNTTKKNLKINTRNSFAQASNIIEINTDIKSNNKQNSSTTPLNNEYSYTNQIKINNNLASSIYINQPNDQNLYETPKKRYQNSNFIINSKISENQTGNFYDNENRPTPKNSELINKSLSKKPIPRKGKLIFSSNGDIYEGDLINNLPNGTGKLIEKETNSIYIGEFIDGYKCGYGKEIFSDNSTYEGQYIKNKRNGKGKFILSNGSIYEGDFEDDIIQGKGKFIWNDNKNYEGEWKNNELDGFGSFYQDNKKYIGYFSNNKKNGFGINYFYDSNNYIVGKWKDDAVEGIALFKSMKKGRQILTMENNKLIESINDENKIKEIKTRKEFVEMEKFYKGIIKSEYVDKNMIFDDYLI